MKDKLIWYYIKYGLSYGIITYVLSSWWKNIEEYLYGYSQVSIVDTWACLILCAIITNKLWELHDKFYTFTLNESVDKE